MILLAPIYERLREQALTAITNNSIFCSQFYLERSENHFPTRGDRVGIEWVLQQAPDSSMPIPVGRLFPRNEHGEKFNPLAGWRPRRDWEESNKRRSRAAMLNGRLFRRTGHG
jgi:hypothetical protein